MTRLGGALIAMLALAGCAAAPRAPDPAAAPDPASLRQWTASGRMAIAAGSEGGSGSFTWQQDDATTRLDLRGPLGAGAVRLTIAPGFLTLADGSGRVLDAGAAEADLRARLGADLPWTSLRYWMLGVADPGSEAAVQDADNVPWRVIEQGGWRLSYEAFRAEQGLELPQRFSAERAPVRVRVVVDRWAPGPAASGPAEPLP